MPIYASTFRASPSLRTDKLAPVHLYDESVKVIAQVEVDYVVRCLKNITGSRAEPRINSCQYAMEASLLR